MQVPVRVSELRAAGFNIVSYWSEVEQDGRKHRIGTYALLPGKWKKPTGRVKLAANFEEAYREARITTVYNIFNKTSYHYEGF